MRRLPSKTHNTRAMGNEPATGVASAPPSRNVFQGGARNDRLESEPDTPKMDPLITATEVVVGGEVVLQLEIAPVATAKETRLLPRPSWLHVGARCIGDTSRRKG